MYQPTSALQLKRYNKKVQNNLYRSTSKDSRNSAWNNRTPSKQGSILRECCEVVKKETDWRGEEIDKLGNRWRSRSPIQKLNNWSSRKSTKGDLSVEIQKNILGSSKFDVSEFKNVEDAQKYRSVRNTTPDEFTGSIISRNTYGHINQNFYGDTDFDYNSSNKQDYYSTKYRTNPRDEKGYENPSSALNYQDYLNNKYDKSYPSTMDEMKKEPPGKFSRQNTDDDKNKAYVKKLGGNLSRQNMTEEDIPTYTITPRDRPYDHINILNANSDIDFKIQKPSLEPNENDRYMRQSIDDKFKISMGMNQPHKIDMLLDNGSFTNIKQAKLGKYALADFSKTLVPCPHCGRKFKQDHSTKHIDICSRSQYKPKRIAVSGRKL